MLPNEIPNLPPNELRGRSAADLRALFRAVLPAALVAEAERLEDEESEKARRTLALEVASLQKRRDAEIPPLDKRHADAGAKLVAARAQVAAAERAETVARQERDQAAARLDASLAALQERLRQFTARDLSGARAKLQQIRVEIAKEPDAYSGRLTDVKIEKLKRESHAREQLERLALQALPANAMRAAADRIVEQLEHELGSIDLARHTEQVEQRERETEARDRFWRRGLRGEA